MNNTQPSTTRYVLLRLDCFNAPTKIDVFAFILTRRHACV